MYQLTFTDMLPLPKRKKGVRIPESIVAPFESKKKVNSKAFNDERRVFKKYVKAIGSYHNLSFIEARELLIEHRDEQEPIILDADYFF